MQWNDSAIILSCKPHKERAALLGVFSKDHGIYHGMIRGAHSKSNQGLLEPGNLVQATWKARLEEHLGTLQCEANTAIAASIFHSPVKLSLLSSLCSMLTLTLAERDPHPSLFEQSCAFLQLLANSSAEDTLWQAAYIEWELNLLQEIGYGLDLTCCAATGEIEDLIYVSPKSGRAVSKEAGAPYADKLLPLPAFLSQNNGFLQECGPISAQDITKGLALTGYFLDKYILTTKGKPLPEARNRASRQIEKMIETKMIETTKVPA